MAGVAHRFVMRRRRVKSLERQPRTSRSHNGHRCNILYNPFFRENKFLAKRFGHRLEFGQVHSSRGLKGEARGDQRLLKECGRKWRGMSP